MNDIEWEEDAVCYANGAQHDWDLNKIENLIIFDDFQLNEPHVGDYIPKSELDTEQKYDDAVEVFGLFGIPINEMEFKHLSRGNTFFVVDTDWEFIGTNEDDSELERKITYAQLMAIGKLKRLMNERDKVNTSERPNSSEVVMQKNKPVVAQVMIDLTERMEIGIKTYGEALRANNGRDALQDAYEEALDLACYLKQAMIERDNANTN